MRIDASYEKNKIAIKEDTYRNRYVCGNDFCWLYCSNVICFSFKLTLVEIIYPDRDLSSVGVFSYL